MNSSSFLAARCLRRALQATLSTVRVLAPVGVCLVTSTLAGCEVRHAAANGTSDARLAEVPPSEIRIGPLLLNDAGEALSLRLPAPSLAEALAGPSRPFSLTIGATTKPADRVRHEVTSLAVVSEQKGEAVLRLVAATLPGVSVDLRVRVEQEGLQFEPVGIAEGKASTFPGIETRFTLRPGFECLKGFVAYSNGDHACSAPQEGTVAAFCLAGGCDNHTIHQSPALSQSPTALGSRLGAELLRTPNRRLEDARLFVFLSAHPSRTLELARSFQALRRRVGRTADGGSTLFLNSPVSAAADPAECPDASQICPANAYASAKAAAALGFEELQFADYTWLARRGTPASPSYGYFDPVPELRTSLDLVRAAGIAPILHQLASLVNLENEICRLNPLNVPAPPWGCWASSGRDPNAGNNFVLDTNQPWAFDEMTGSMAAGLTRVQAAGIYSDGSDWFGRDSYAAVTFIEEMTARVEGLRVRPNYTHGNATMFARETGFQDRFQIYNHVSPRAWALGYGYYALSGLQDKMSIRGVLGWVPTPTESVAHPGYRPDAESYQQMLNAAVATGSTVTIQADGDDPALAGRKHPWFRLAMRRTNDAVRELRRDLAEGFYAGGDARHDVHHFTSGASTVALFDRIVPAGNDGRLEARAFGVKETLGASCAPFESCFFLSGAPRELSPSDYSTTLGEKGAFLYHPGFAGTASSEYTITAWIKPEDFTSNGAIFEKGWFGFGLGYADGAFVTHLTPSDGLGTISFLPKVVYDPASTLPWKHLAASWSNADKRFRHFVDGRLVADEATSWTTTFYESNPVWVGTRGHGTQRGYRGYLHDVRLYDRPLADQDVAAVFRGEQASVRAVLAWSAGRAQHRADVAVDLGGQSVVYLVPMLEEGTLPPETVHLTFRNLRDPSSTRVDSDVPIAARRVDGNALVLEVDSAAIGASPVRVAIER